MNEFSETPLSSDNHVDLIRRFDAGDRSAALLDALNRAAFQCFHAPWEQEPPRPLRLRQLSLPSESLSCEPQGESCSSFPDEEELSAAEEVVPGETKALLHHLYSLGYRVFLDGLLSLRVELPYDPIADCHAVVAIEVDPCDNLLRFRTWSDLRDDTWNPIRAKIACTRWNRKMPRMKACLRTPKEGREGAGERLVATGKLQLEPCYEIPGPFTETLGHLLHNCRDFWRFARLKLRRSQDQS